MNQVRHNHVTRDIKKPGQCPACDRYNAHVPRLYNVDGTEHTARHEIAPILLIMQDDIDSGKALPEYHPGWYFQDEAELIHGPVATFEEAVENYKSYCDAFEKGLV